MSKQERAARTRSALIRSAAELFEQCGYTKASLYEISAGAGVSRGALHFHFVNKADLADAVEGAAARSLHRAARGAEQGQTNALQALTNLSHTFAQLLSRDVVVRAGFRINGDAGLHTGRDLRRQWQSCVRDLVSRAGEEEALARDVAQEPLVMTVVGATTGFEVLGRANGHWLSHYSLTGFWQLLLPVVAAPRVLATLDPAGSGPPADTLPGQFKHTGDIPPRTRRCSPGPRPAAIGCRSCAETDAPATTGPRQTGRPRPSETGGTPP
ncbi:ScbR family autoregulator-binding transcription factor [Streptomyces cyaneofuscatus]|uniref:ScbR family autoregulator-binding transcription factor n=1 Tax=Streptomyces cyaneofuscatus TaxID=66883 RepID=UPI003649571E